VENASKWACGGARKCEATLAYLFIAFMISRSNVATVVFLSLFELGYRIVSLTQCAVAL